MCSYADTIRFAPGMAIAAMENGGMIFTDDGEYVDAIDVLLPTRDHLSIDVVNGDGDKGRVSVPYYDGENMFTEFPDEFRSEDTESPEEELNRLMAEQSQDDASTNYIATNPDDAEDETLEEVAPSQSGEGRQRFAFQGDSAFQRFGTRDKCSRRNAGRKPEHKGHKQARPQIW